MQDEYKIFHVNRKPWLVEWIYNSGKRIAKYKINSIELKKGEKAKPYGISTLKVKKDWKCEVCHCPINKGDKAILLTGRFYCDRYYVHPHCIDLDIC